MDPMVKHVTEFARVPAIKEMGAVTQLHKTCTKVVNERGSGAGVGVAEESVVELSKKANVAAALVAKLLATAKSSVGKQK